MSFIHEFDRTKPLEEQIDFPYGFHSDPDIFIHMIPTNKRRRFQLTDGADKYHEIAPLEAQYAVALGEDKYVTNDEFWHAMHSEDTYDTLPHRIIANLRKSIKKITDRKIIHTKRGVKEIMNPELIIRTGFYIEKLADARNEEENMLIWGGYTFNALTGCLTLPNNTIIETLAPFEAAIFNQLMRLKGRSISTRNLSRKVYDDSNSIGSITVLMYRIRKKMGKEYLPPAYKGKPHQLVCYESRG